MGPDLHEYMILPTAIMSVRYDSERAVFCTINAEVRNRYVARWFSMTVHVQDNRMLCT